MAYLNRSGIYFNTFIIILIAVSLAFLRMLVPFYGAIFWAIVLAVLFRPLQLWQKHQCIDHHTHHLPADCHYSTDTDLHLVDQRIAVVLSAY
jgi:hypothetical protein